MSKFESGKVIPRYFFLVTVMSLVAVMVLGRAVYTMTAKRDFWLAVADRIKVDSVAVPATRGNILSCDGQLLASSLPEYKMFMDFKALKESHTDTLWAQKIDTICAGLHDIFPEMSAAEFRSHLQEGFDQDKRHWPVWPKRVDFNTYTEVKSLPVFNLPRSGASGFHAEEYGARKRTYGSLASRTIGTMYGELDSARFGLELAYDSILRGTDGVAHSRKILKNMLPIVDQAPIDGADLVTTIDVTMQDLAERAVVDELRLIDGNVGVAIVMEVATGDVKAIVNMEKYVDSATGEVHYSEQKNHAVSDLLEPGSVFKTASIMVALDDGVVDTTYTVETGAGVWPMYGRDMKDWNWSKGGYGRLTLPQTLHYSSNIGISRIIDDHYRDCPEKFVEGIYRLGLHDDLHLPFVGSTPARIRMPKKDSRGRQYTNWSKTTLPWMSIGYETQVPPISTLTFYNAIANGGRMMQPRFVKQVVKDGQVVREYPPVVLRESIAKKSTITKIQTILEQVVSQGLGRKAGSPSFLVAGKTGTAQISQGAAGYRTGRMNYLVSFAGYFPADKPRYSCIVCIQKSGLPASGGGMSGVVFHNIAEGIMAQDVKLNVADARDSLSILLPPVKTGNVVAADYVLSHLGFTPQTDWDPASNLLTPLWGQAVMSGRTISLQQRRMADKSLMPDVQGMGARDAVYLIESRGVRVVLSGCGKVTEQSIPAGRKIEKGMVCRLRLG